MQTCTIIGGGIAGLSTAIALEQAGIRAEVFEAAPEIKALGAGLILAANAMKAYRKMGLLNDILPLGRALDHYTVYDRRGRPITRTDSLLVGNRYGVDNFSIHRGDLHTLLCSKIDPGCIHTGKRAVGIDTDSNGGVTVRFEDGTTRHTDCLVVADGIHSAIRRQLCPGSEPRYAGYTCWRAVTRVPGSDLRESSETWGRNGRFGIVPLSDKRIYWFATVNAPPNDPVLRTWRVADLQRHFDGFHDPIPEILRHTRDEELIWNDINDLKPIARYAYGPVVLVGDAAHATTPNLGQGACQAIEDAVLLAEALRSETDCSKAFRTFEKQRIARTHWVVNTSRSVGKLATTANPVLAALRDFVFRSLPPALTESQFRRLYDIDF